MFVLLQLQALPQSLLPLPVQLLHLELLQQQLLPEFLPSHQLVLQILPQVGVLNFPLLLQLVPFPLLGFLSMFVLLQLQDLPQSLLPLLVQHLHLELLQRQFLLEKSFPPQPVLFQLPAFQYPKHGLLFPASQELHR